MIFTVWGRNGIAHDIRAGTAPPRCDPHAEPLEFICEFEAWTFTKKDASREGQPPENLLPALVEAMQVSQSAPGFEPVGPAFDRDEYPTWQWSFTINAHSAYMAVAVSVLICELLYLLGWFGARP